jgi:antagonist of KipI
MSEIQVQAPGFFTTVQDLGREGFGPMGISASGAADPIALRLGNRLVGNADGMAALEMTLMGGVFLFPDGGVVALAGADFPATLDGMVVEPWTAVKIAPSQILRVGHTRSGARCYLCVQGGIAVESFLGSASTHVLSGLGGLNGRTLQKSDVLSIGASDGIFRKRRLAPWARETLAPRKVLRVTPGPQESWFLQSSRQAFYGSGYRVAEGSNRMGLRLDGPTVALQASREMITEGVPLGAVQVPEGGQPIILFVEQQTTGGYPKIANVIAADLPSLGQLRPRDEIRFERTEWEQARRWFSEQQKLLAAQELILDETD